MKSANHLTLLEIREIYEKLIPVTLKLGMNIGPIQLLASAAELCPNKLGTTSISYPYLRKSCRILSNYEFSCLTFFGFVLKLRNVS
jgi:hypothetical protein